MPTPIPAPDHILRVHNELCHPQGIYRAKQLSDVFDFLGFLIICYGICGFLIIPKWLSKVPRTYCNTFWFPFGTSKLFTKSGHLHHVSITKNASNNIRKIMEASLKILFISQHFANPHFQFVDTTGHHKCWTYLCFFLLLRNASKNRKIWTRP